AGSMSGTEYDPLPRRNPPTGPDVKRSDGGLLGRRLGPLVAALILLSLASVAGVATWFGLADREPVPDRGVVVSRRAAPIAHGGSHEPEVQTVATGRDELAKPVPQSAQRKQEKPNPIEPASTRSKLVMIRSKEVKTQVTVA